MQRAPFKKDIIKKDSKDVKRCLQNVALPFGCFFFWALLNMHLLGVILCHFSMFLVAASPRNAFVKASPLSVVVRLVAHGSEGV